MLSNSSESSSEELRHLVTEFKTLSARLITALEARVPIVATLKGVLDSTPVPLLCDVFVSAIGIDFAELVTVLNAVPLVKRFEAVLKIISKQTLMVNTVLNVAETV